MNKVTAAFRSSLLIAVLVLFSGHVSAQSQDMDHAAMGHGDVQTQGGMDHGAMDHGGMQMQGGSPPADARDPHAYSDGYTLTEGPYALAASQRLVLADEHPFWAVLGDRMEYDTESDSGIYDLQAWYGTTYNRLTAKLEGDVADGTLEESQSEVFWSRAFSVFFDTQLGMRFDQFDEGKNRQWLAVGIQGLAPYWFELDITAYVGDGGRTALSVEAEYDLLLSQRLILQPRAEFNAYGKDDRINGLGGGLSDAEFGIRLRYEFSRQFAPYVGVEWSRRFGDTADFARVADEPVRDTRYVMGVRFWF